MVPTTQKQEVEDLVCAHPPQSDQDPVGLSPGSLFIWSQQVLHHGHSSENTKPFTSLCSNSSLCWPVGLETVSHIYNQLSPCSAFLIVKHHRRLITSCLGDVL